MSLPSLVTTIFAQATNAASAAATGTATVDNSTAPQQPFWITLAPFLLIAGVFYFGLIRPQANAKKQAEEKVRAAKTGDKVVTISGIHGVISNVKETTVILKIADNVKIEIEKSSIDKIIKPEGSSSSEKTAASKA